MRSSEIEQKVLFKDVSFVPGFIQRWRTRVSLFDSGVNQGGEEAE